MACSTVSMLEDAAASEGSLAATTASLIVAVAELSVVMAAGSEACEPLRASVDADDTDADATGVTESGG